MSINRKVADCKMEAKATFGCLATIVVLMVAQIITYYYKYFLHYPYLRSPDPLNFQQKTSFDEFLSEESKLKSNANINIKYILYYTKFFDQEDWGIGYGQRPFIDAECSVQNCHLTSNKAFLSNINRFDAILFHMRNMEHEKPWITKSSTWNKMMNERNPQQRYIMYTLESPANDKFPYGFFDNFFNWTMTYRLDSDIPQPYGWISRIGDASLEPPSGTSMVESSDVMESGSQGQPFDYSDLAPQLESAKTHSPQKRLIAWMVSNCHTVSQRENYVLELQKYVPVDVYGKCKNAMRDKTKLLSCPKGLGDECWEMINKKYKFYLSFENSRCYGYITEKFWKIMERDDVVPIVLGGADYHSHAPENSYIDAKKFSSVKDLANFILEIDKNETERQKYFNWKTMFRATHKFSSTKIKLKRICRICEALNAPLTTWPIKSYPHIQDWWRGESGNGHCIQ